MDKKKLMEEALIAREELSYSPYSKFKVGAAVVTKDGTIYRGANIENAAYGLCMCGERNAIFNAKMHGVKKEDFVALAIVADTDEPVSPCGSCRQVISELFPKDGLIILFNLKGDVKETTIKELLPFSFDQEDVL